MDKERLHYYAFSFMHDNKTASIYVGFGQPAVSIPRILEAKKNAEMPDDSVLIGLGYMGYMTSDEVTNLL